MHAVPPQGVVNRDIKLENTLIDTATNPDGPPTIKICDFGFSKDEKVGATGNQGF